MAVLGAVPIKPFLGAKHRLGTALSPPQRKALAQHLGRRVLLALLQAGAEPLALVADDEVEAWVLREGFQAILDPAPNLNQAAAGAVHLAATTGRAWLIVHGDLAFIDPQAVKNALAALEAGRPVIAPSPDGGTPLLGWSSDEFAFAYGPSSFHHHLRQVAPNDPAVLVDHRLVFDIDRPADLMLALARDPNLSDLLSSLPSS